MAITINQDHATIGVQTIIDTLQLQVAEAQQRGELTPEIAQQAQARLALATQAAKQEQPDKASVRENLEGAKTLIESFAAAGGLVSTFMSAAEAVQKLLP